MSKSACDGSQGKGNSLYEKETTLKTARALDAVFYQTIANNYIQFR